MFFKVILNLSLLTFIFGKEYDINDPNAPYLGFGGKCTAMSVSAGASLSNGPMVTHTSDCLDCDFRINKMVAIDWDTNATPDRPLYEYRGQYPLTLTNERGKTWSVSNLEGSDSQLKAWGSESTRTGTIPQVKHTHALIEGQYGMANEHGLIFGESTCAAKLWAAPTSAGGKASIEIRDLSRIALERSKTAREAITLMGTIAESKGFYAADWSGGDASKGEGGEALTVADKTEAWVFHILSDDTGTSAVWAAQQVPDGHVAAVANQFVIRKIDPARRGKDLLYSDNIFKVALRTKFWDGQGVMDFTKTFAPPRAHSPYATRRVWRVFNMLAPSYELNPYTDTYASDYPFSVPVDKKLSPRDLMAVHRDHYEGTEFDLTKGLAAGPFGDPSRFDPAPVNGMTMKTVLNGSFERAIGMFRTSTSIVAESRGSLPDAVATRVWVSQYNPTSASYVPMYPTASGDLPKEYTRGSLFKYDPSVAFWNFCAVGNYAARFYNVAMKEVHSLQMALEDEVFAATEAVEESVKRLIINGDTTGACLQLGQLMNQQATNVASAWSSLLGNLFTHFHDGYHASGLDAPTINMERLFYPEWWLKAVGYFKNIPNNLPGMIWFSSGPNVNPTVSSSLADDHGPPPLYDADGNEVRPPFPPHHPIFHLLVIALCGTIGYYLGRRSVKQEESSGSTGFRSYQEIPESQGLMA